VERTDLRSGPNASQWNYVLYFANAASKAGISNDAKRSCEGQGMAEPIENKSSLTDQLEEDRQKMALQAGELKEAYNLARRIRESVQKYPWGWMLGAVLTGFVISRLPARKKEVYLWADPALERLVRKIPVRETNPARIEKQDSSLMDKLWSITKPIMSAYIGREIYKRMKRPVEET
jgi:hypothetical protein